jgi:glutathione S-transferase
MSSTAYTLAIGSRNYSSWSLRAWLALKLCGIAFDTEFYDLRSPERAKIKATSPSAMVPVLRVSRQDAPSFDVWDTLAIAEFLAERHLHAHLWPIDPFARARARSVSAEMHSGFADLRRTCPMDMIARVADHPITDETNAQIRRITQIWNECRNDFGSGGDFLFGSFGIADCFFAPVVSRFQTYAIALDGPARGYAEAVLSWAAMKQWIAEATREEGARAA